MNFNNRRELIKYSVTLLIACVALLIFSFLYLDRIVANYFNRPELQVIYYYSREITNIGYSIHYFIAALIGIIFSKWIYPKSNSLQLKLTPNSNKKILSWSVFSIRAFIIIGVILNILKFLIGRQRPHAAVDFYNLNFDMLSTDSHWHSFPSGHSQVMFTVATLLTLFFPKNKYIFLFLALIFSATRVTIHQHFLSDMITGAYIGHIGTLWLYQLWPPRHIASHVKGKK